MVHHRHRSNAPKVLVTLCIRCHIRIHRSSGIRHWLSGLPLQLWRELHEPMQLRLALHSRQATDAPTVPPSGRPPGAGLSPRVNTPAAALPHPIAGQHRRALRVRNFPDLPESYADRLDCKPLARPDEYLLSSASDESSKRARSYVRSLALSGTADADWTDVSSHKGRHLAEAYGSRHEG